MLDLSLNLPTDRRPLILCIGAHCDDIEIGCGGTLLGLAGSRTDARFVWAIFTGDQSRQNEATKSARSMFPEDLPVELRLHDFPDGRLPYAGTPVKDAMEKLKSEVNPDLIFCHWGGDSHQDHSFLSELTWNTFRNHMILEYEIPKYDGDFGNPNVYVNLEPNIREHKIAHILRSYPSQSSRAWFDTETFTAILRLRGLECRAESGYAEAFYGRKLPIRT
jgi:LmbE family N-acetylglucosaminyl deacetylase